MADILDSIGLSLVGWIVVAWFGAYGDFVAAIIGVAYYIGFWTAAGQTPGKSIMKVEIVKANGTPIGIGRATLRFIGYFVSTITLCIGFLMIVWDSKKQGLHDKIAGTVVIRVAQLGDSVYLGKKRVE